MSTTRDCMYLRCACLLCFVAWVQATDEGVKNEGKEDVAYLMELPAPPTALGLESSHSL